MDVYLSIRRMVIVASLAMEKEHEEAAYKLPRTLKKRNCQCSNSNWNRAVGGRFSARLRSSCEFRFVSFR
jgi:hypothetical protein